MKLSSTLTLPSLWLCGMASLLACADSTGGSGGADGTGTSTVSAAGPSGTGGHGCFATETTCDGLCVDVNTHPEHCGGCNQPCGPNASQPGVCLNGECDKSCPAGFGPLGELCTNFFGAFETFPVECPGCSTPTVGGAVCGCPAFATALPLHVQSDCPGIPMRSPTELTLCTTAGLAADSDFGGAYQVDDLPGWCGATAQCRVGNPYEGGSCACPAGFTPIALRSIIELPCGGEVGTQIVLCHNEAAPIATFGGAFQVDDVAPSCRVTNPRTGACSCPTGTNEQVHRIMVDGPAGLYGSTARLCVP